MQRGPDRAASLNCSQNLKWLRNSGQPRKTSTRRCISYASCHAGISRKSLNLAMPRQAAMGLPRRLARNHVQNRLSGLVESKILRLFAPPHMADFATAEASAVAAV